MQNKFIDDVKQWREQLGLTIKKQATIPSEETRNLKLRLITGEFAELVRAIEKDRMPEIADGMVDLVWVIINASMHYGINFETVWDAVAESEMKKKDKDSSGKVIKPVGFTHPDIAKVLDETSIHYGE